MSNETKVVPPSKEEKKTSKSSIEDINKAFILFGLAGKKFNNTQIVEAIADLDQAIKLFPYYVFYHYRAEFRFRIAVSNAILKQAEADFETCIRLMPDFSEAYIMAAHSYLRHDKTKHLDQILHLIALYASLDGIQTKFRKVEEVEFSLSVEQQAKSLTDFFDELMPVLIEQISRVSNNYNHWRKLAENVQTLTGPICIDKIKAVINQKNRLKCKALIAKLGKVRQSISKALAQSISHKSIKIIKRNKTADEITYTLSDDRVYIVNLSTGNQAVKKLVAQSEDPGRKELVEDVVKNIQGLISVFSEMHDLEEAYHWATQLIQHCPEYIFYINRVLIFWGESSLKSDQNFKKVYQDLSFIIQMEPKKSFAYLLRAQLNLIKYKNSKIQRVSAKEEAFADLQKFFELQGITEDLASSSGRFRITTLQQEAQLIQFLWHLFSTISYECSTDSTPFPQVLNTLMMLEKIIAYKPKLVFQGDESFFSAFAFYLKKYEEVEGSDYLLILVKKFLEIFDVALQSSPTLQLFYYYRARGHYNVKQYPEALVWLEKAVHKDCPPFFYYLLGKIYWELGRNDEAIIAFHKSIQEGIHSYKATLALVSLHAERGDIEKAKEQLSRTKKIIKESRKLDKDFTVDQNTLDLIRKYSDRLQEKDEQLPVHAPEEKNEREDQGEQKNARGAQGEQKKEKLNSEKTDIKKIHQRLSRTLKNNIPDVLRKQLSVIWLSDKPLELIINNNSIYLNINLNAELHPSVYAVVQHSANPTPHFEILLNKEQLTAAGLVAYLLELAEILRIVDTQLMQASPLLSVAIKNEKVKKWLGLTHKEQESLLSAFTIQEIIVASETDPHFEYFSLLHFYPCLPLPDIIKLKQLSKKCDEEKVECAIHGSFVWFWVAKLLINEEPFAIADIDLILFLANPLSFTDTLKQLEAKEYQRGHKFVQYKINGTHELDLTIREDNNRSYDPLPLARHRYILKEGFLRLDDEKHELKKAIENKIVAVDIPDANAKASSFFYRVIKYHFKAQTYKLDPSVQKVLMDPVWIRHYLVAWMNQPVGKRAVFLEFVTLIKKNYLPLPIANTLIKTYLSLLFDNFLGLKIFNAQQDKILKGYAAFLQYLAQQSTAFFTPNTSTEFYLVLQQILICFGSQQLPKEFLPRLVCTFPDEEFQDIKPPSKQIEEPIVAKINLEFKRFQAAVLNPGAQQQSMFFLERPHEKTPPVRTDSSQAQPSPGQ